MGHANLSNLSHFFVKRLYAKGKLSLRETCEAAEKDGEELRASEGDYSDARSIALGMMSIIHHLTLENPRQHGYREDYPERGPWIVADLSVWFGKRKSVTSVTRVMLEEINGGNLEELTVGAAADRLEEEGFPEWATHVRIITLLRQVHQKWTDDGEYDYSDDEIPNGEGWYAFDMIPWRYAPGWRKRYREVPILENVTN